MDKKKLPHRFIGIFFDPLHLDIIIGDMYKILRMLLIEMLSSSFMIKAINL